MAMRRIGQVLVDLGHLTEGQLEAVLEEQQTRPGELFGSIAVAMGMLNEDHVTQALAEQLGLQVINMTDMVISPDVLSHLTQPMAELYRVIPIAFKDGTLTVASCDPQKISVIDELRSFLGYDIRACVATEQEILAGLDRFYGASGESVETLISGMENDVELAKAAAEAEAVSGAHNLTDLENLAESAPVRKLLNMVLLLGIRDHASDLHFEPFETEFKIRIRADGVLYEMVPPPRHLAFAITTRIKVMADLDIAERRVPQDGRIRLNVGGHPVDLRVSVLPTMFGESVVCRILDRSVVMLDMGMVGLEPDMLREFRKVIRRPNGIVLVTGPTGSGKTTTLYGALNELNTIEDKLITTEDPVEYDMEGIVQMPIDASIGNTFAQCLRSILRQDPDKILVGEIRDLETAENAVQASLTGHLVFSTLHTNDAAGAFMRLADMGVEPFLVCSTVEGVMAQRLVRTLCKECREQYVPRQEDLPDDFPWAQFMDTVGHLYGANGCRSCRGTGYAGRCGIYELLVANDEIRALATERTGSNIVKQAAIRSGMRTLRSHGWLKTMQGVTTIDEILRVSKAD